MAKQVGPLFFTGTVDDLIFYKLSDQYLMRSKGSYKSGKQMRRDPKYTRTLEQADRFGRASKVVKGIYYFHLPRCVRKQGLYGKLTGMVNTWLYEGKSEKEAEALLLAHCRQLAASVTQPAPAAIAMKEGKPATKSEPATTGPGEAQPSSVNEQPATPSALLSAVNYPPSSNNAQPATVTAQPSSVIYPPSSNHPKRPRYLSRWKVKRNGSLHIPARAPGASYQEPIGIDVGSGSHTANDRYSAASPIKRSAEK